jgi:hypothetical protein
MAPVILKTQIAPIDGTPIKRMFLSIINDYDLRTGLCELIDNAIDPWLARGKKKPLKVVVTLDVDTQFISVSDNAGGVAFNDLPLLITPGGSRNSQDAEVIGIFGVGSKRAEIALGKNVEIKTRCAKQQSYQIDITEDWLAQPGWEIPAYTIPDIDPGTTRVEISRLRQPITADDLEALVAHLGDTYAWFVGEGCSIVVNKVEVNPRSFDHWAYPRGHSPLSSTFAIDLGDDGKMGVTITAGLIRDRDPELENYGVYFACNHRLIVKELKVREVGYFVTSEAGVPHPDASLCRVIVELQGPAKAMPWNSSKSGINYSHPAFQHVRPTLIQLVSHFSKLSRRLKEDWPGNVFRPADGTIGKIDPVDAEKRRKLNLPDLPHVNKQQVEKLKTTNRNAIRDQPWTLGLVEAMSAVNILGRQKLETKNRIALILLDSNFEIALKEFIVHDPALFPPSVYNNAHIQKLFGNRPNVIAEVAKKVTLDPKLLARAQHYYGLRNKLIHERATVDVTESDVENYRQTIEEILGVLFKLKFPAH